MKLYWRRIRIYKSASKRAIKEAKTAAAKHPRGVLKSLEFTEKNYEWVLLYDHIRKGQLTPSVMRHMRRQDLYYLAGLTFTHPALTQPKDPAKRNALFVYDITTELKWEEQTKIQGNAIRAQEELRRRNFFWSSLLVIVAALIAVVAGILTRN